MRHGRLLPGDLQISADTVTTETYTGGDIIDHSSNNLRDTPDQNPEKFQIVLVALSYVLLILE